MTKQSARKEAIEFSLRRSLMMLPLGLLISGWILASTTLQAEGAGWKIDFDGSGSSPVVADGVLYVGSADGAVYALNPETGETKWRFQTGDSLPPASSGSQIITVPRGASISDQMAAGLDAAQKQRTAGTRRIDMAPAVEDGTVFIGSGDRSFYAIDAATGRRKWSYEAGAGMASNNNSPLPIRAPMLKNGTVYFVTEEGLHALDALTGKRKWLFETLQEVPVKKMNLGRKRKPAGPVLGDGGIYLTAWPYGLSGAASKSFVYAVDPESGKAKWVTSVDDLDITEPVAAKGLIFVATHSSILSSSHQATLYAINAADGQIKWKFGSEKNYGTSRLLISGNAIYFSTDKSVSALELETGQPLWRFSADEIQGDLRADDQNLYVITHKGSMARPDDTLRAVACATGQEKWSQELSGAGYSQLLHDGVVYAGHLHAIDAGTGKRLWSFKGTGRDLAPVVSGGRIFVTSPTVGYTGTSRVDQGQLYAVDARTGKP